MELYLQRKAVELGETPVTALCPPQIPHGLTPGRTWASAVKGRRNRLSHSVWPYETLRHITAHERSLLDPVLCKLNRIHTLYSISQKYISY